MIWSQCAAAQTPKILQPFQEVLLRRILVQTACEHKHLEEFELNLVCVGHFHDDLNASWSEY